jgi:tetratricopeptide (TPR) repeat protein
LLRRSGLLPPDAPLEQASQEEQALAIQISRELGGLPLALDQTGAYLEETGESLTEYWQLYQQYRANLLRDRRGGLVADHPLSVTTTWSVSFQRIRERNPVAAELLRLLAWLPPDDIAEEILSAGAAFLGPVLAPIAGNRMMLNQAIEALRAYSLVRRDPRVQTLSMHRLVQAVLQDQQEQMERQTWGERAMRAVNAAFPHAKYETWAQCERLLPLALAAAERIEQQQMTFQEAGRLLFETASYLQDRARYREAEALYRRALAIWEQQLGPEHPNVAHPLNDLAGLYRERGKYAEAEELYQRALAIREQQLGLVHPETAETIHDLAAFREMQGNYQEAFSLYQRAFAIREQVLGTEHPKTRATHQRLTALRQSVIQEAVASPQDDTPPEQSDQNS